MAKEIIKTDEMILSSKMIGNFNKSGLKNIDSVPVGNISAYKVLKEDSDVYEFINSVLLGPDNRAQLDSWTDIELTEEWANSFVAAVKASPKPLFIRGHAEYSISSKERAIPDAYVTGGLVANGTMYLRNTMILSGTEEKKALIEQTMKEIKADMLSTSTYDYMKYKIVTEEDSYDETYFAIESVKAQSNALVEADQTGSDAAIILTSFKASNGNEDEREQGEERMEKITNAERFLSLKNQLETGSLALKDVAKELGLELITASDKIALKRLNDAEVVVGDISVYIAEAVETKAGAFKTLKDTKLNEKFKNDPELIEIATSLFNLKDGDAKTIDGEIERIASMKVFETIQGSKAGAINLSLGGTNLNVSDESDDMEA